MSAARTLAPALVLAFGLAAGQEPISTPYKKDEVPSYAATPRPLPDAQDVPIEQIQMHVFISEVTNQGLRDLGVNLRYTRFVDGVENPSDSLQQVETSVFDPLNPNFRVTLPAPDQGLFAPPLRPDLAGDLADGVQTQSGAGLTFTLVEDGHGTIEGIFRSIEEKSDVDLISKPELLVINGLPAGIHAGGRVPYQDLTYDKSGNPQLDVAFQEVGVNMQVTPTIRADGMIELSLHKLDVTDLVRIDNIRGVDLPVFSTRSQTGRVIVPNGSTGIIGGLTSEVVRKTERRVPIIGRLPIVGIPFRSRRAEVAKGRLLIFVAPTVVDLRDMTPTMQSAMDFWQGAGWRNQKRIFQEIDEME